MYHKENILSIECHQSGKRFFFFGSEHSNNQEHVQFAEIKKEWDDFLKHTDEQRVVFGEIPVLEISADYVDVVKKYGEAGAVYWYAKNSNTDAFCPEPDIHDQRTALCKEFSPEHVAYALILQNLASWFHHQRGRTFNEAVSFTVQREATFKDIYGYTPTIEWLEMQHNKLHGDRDIKDRKFLQSVSDPRKHDTEVNMIIAARTRIRNEHILAKIVEQWNLGKSIFVVYGKGHLDTLRDSLKDKLLCDV